MNVNKNQLKNLLSSPWLWLSLGALLVVSAFWHMMQSARPGMTTLPYSTFRQYVDEGKVIRITTLENRIEGELKRTDNSGTPAMFTTTLPSIGDAGLFPLLRQQGVEVKAETQTTSWTSMLTGALPYILPIGLVLLLMSNMQKPGGEIMKFGRSGAKVYNREGPRTTFSDVAGAEGAKYELAETVEFLRDPAKFQRLGGQMPRGVLLVGPPGTGKTLLARAVAGEANVPFFHVTGSNFMEMFVGVGAARVRDLFTQAKAAAPAIIFIDEIDSIGRRRGISLGAGHDEREQTLNQILSEMDGFEGKTEVIIIAATNRPDILDPALLRPGRFDRQVTVDLPTLNDRLAILKVHARGKPLAKNVELRVVAQGTPGFSGADLANLMNEAALLAARLNKQSIEASDLDLARDKVMMGLEHEGMTLSAEDKHMIAFHEAGHALAAHLLPFADPVHKVTIIPRGRGLGVTQQLPEGERHIYRREHMLDRLAVIMGGRAAESLVFDSMTTGAENDLKEARKLARRMVLDWGMADSLQHMALSEAAQSYLGEQGGDMQSLSEATAREVDEAVHTILRSAYNRAFSLLQTQRAALDCIADVLLKREAISGEEMAECIKDVLILPRAA
jgi:cell division protease FtsH